MCRNFILPCLFLNVVLGTPTISLHRINSSDGCSHDYLVQGEDYTFIEFDVSGNDSDYLFDIFDGPKFYFTKSDGTLHQPCNTFTSQDGDCIAQNGPDDMFCSCCCQTSSSLRTGFNITAQLDVSNGTVYLRWPGPTTDIFSETYRLPEVRDSCATTSSAPNISSTDGHEDTRTTTTTTSSTTKDDTTEATTDTSESTRRLDKWVIPVILAVNIILLVGIVVALCVISPVNKCDSEWTCGTKALCIVLAAVAVGFLTAFAVIIAEYSDGVENWEKVINIFGIIVNAVLLVYIFIFIFVLKKGYRICLCLKKPNPKSTQVPLTEDVSANKGKTGIEGNYNNLPDNQKDNQQNSQQLEPLLGTGKP